MSKVPALYFNRETGTTIQLRETFESLLSPEIFQEIEDVHCTYVMLGDVVVFDVTRKRDGAKCRFDLPRYRLTHANVENVVELIREDAELLAKLILFLA